MAYWNTEMVTMLRVIINDLDEETYTDARLEQIIVVASYLVLQDVDLTNSYTVSITDKTISPDPADPSNKDTEFINFTVMRAACIADESMFRTQALLEGVKATCGPTSLSVSGNTKGFQYLLDNGPCKTYEEMKRQYHFGQVNFVRAVLSPFVSNDFHSYYTSRYHDFRD